MGSGGRGALISVEEQQALILLRLLPGGGDRRLARSLASTGNACATLALSPREFSSTLGREAERARRDPAIRRNAVTVLRRCRELDIEVLSFGSHDYPSRLLGLVDPPPALFLRGDGSLLGTRGVAVVGSRHATGVGRRSAERLSRELSELGVTVTSGLALGIDGAAHRGALAGRGNTIAVLGSGPDRAYPASNRALFHSIVDRGLVVSEFPPGEPARPYHFPRRNRILAGLSQGVVVVEAARRSGALITVDHALDLGLEVFAVPGSLETIQAEGTNRLIRDGAHLLTRGLDVLEVLGWPPPADRSNATSPRAPTPTPSDGLARPPSTPASDVVRVRAAFGPGPRGLDELVSDVGLPAPRVLAALTRLELGDSVARVGEGWALTRHAL